MRAAATASVLIHLGLIAGAWVAMSVEPAVDELAAESVSVDIISMDAFSESPSEMITATNESLASAGADHEAMEVPETAEAEAVEVAEAEPIKPVVQPVAAAVPEVVAPSESEDLVSAEVMTAAAVTQPPLEGAMPQLVDSAAALVADTVAPSASDPLDAVRTATLAELAPEVPIEPLPSALMQPAEPVEAVQTATLAPVVEETVEEIVPIPRPRIVRTPVEAKTEPVKETATEAREPAKPPAKPPIAKPPAKQANLGNGGNADADSAASKKTGGGQGKKNDGGSAAISKYPGLVQARVARAAKRPKGAGGGEAHVSFTVNASGNVSRVALARSSGNGAVDRAALAAVDRAAPFPPIPADAGRSSWQFTVPIYFKK